MIFYYYLGLPILGTSFEEYRKTMAELGNFVSQNKMNMVYLCIIKL